MICMQVLKFAPLSLTLVDISYSATLLTVATQQTFSFDNYVYVRQLNNPCNGVQLTTVRTLQGGVTVNQVRAP